MPELRDQGNILGGALLQVVKHCNYSCSHCSQDAPLFHYSAGDTFPSVGYLINTVQKLYSVGHRRVRFTGGEPFLHLGLREVVSAAVDLSMEVSFVTNGSNIRKEDLFWLAKLGPFELWVSFYGYPTEVHDLTCRRSGAFVRASTTVRNLVAAGQKVGCYYPSNRSTLDGCGAFIVVLADLGVSRIKIMQLFDQGRASDRYEASVASLGELGALLSELKKAVQRNPSLDLQMSLRSGQRSLFESHGITIQDDVGCHAGLDKLWSVDADGYVYPCCLFMNSGRGQNLNIRDEQIHMARRQHDHSDFALTVDKRYVRGQPPQVITCPAIEHPDDFIEGEFVCPLTFVHIVCS